MTTVKPLVMRRGESATLSGTVTDKDGNAVDVSAATLFKLVVKDSLADSDSDAVINKDASSKNADGSFTFTLDPSDTKSLSLDPRWYQIELTVSSGTYVVTSGRFLLLPDVWNA